MFVLVVFEPEKGQKVKFETGFQRKQHPKRRQFSQNVTDFLKGISCFFDKSL